MGMFTAHDGEVTLYDWERIDEDVAFVLQWQGHHWHCQLLLRTSRLTEEAWSFDLA